ncbi:hypothetical protein [Miniimonas sp. S16]|uniref:hypothetical protein n=1 Tax=Miniimonas sp. S16 TaxID=2171623 RepID=UPI000D5294DC|nr:hypothetical protein [Miniimonas sp. S16]
MTSDPADQPVPPAATPATTPPTQPPGAQPRWQDRTASWFVRAGKTTAVALVIVAVVAVLYLIGAAFLPRWWAQVVGRQVDGSMSSGAAWGVFYGFLFTFLPVLVIAQARRPVFKGWKTKLVVVAVGLLLALPNWLTLWIVVGTTDAAHAGERILDVDAPGFRAGTAVGAAAGVVISLFLVFTGTYLRRRRATLRAREADLAAREARLANPGPVSSTAGTTARTAPGATPTSGAASGATWGSPSGTSSATSQGSPSGPIDPPRSSLDLPDDGR